MILVVLLHPRIGISTCDDLYKKYDILINVKQTLDRVLIKK